MSTCEICKFLSKPAIQGLVVCSWIKERIGAWPVPKCIPAQWDFLRRVCFPDDPCEAWEPRA